MDWIWSRRNSLSGLGLHTFAAQRSSIQLLVNRVGLLELEEPDFRLEAGAVLPAHLVGARHRAEGCRQGTPRRVLEPLSRVEDRLLTHDARPVDLLRLTGRVEDQPVAIEELDLMFGLVDDRNGVEEEPAALPGIRMLRRVTRLNLDSDSLGYGLGGS
jgi:hypothetical protein